MILNTGQIIASRYEIIEKIGQGGMSLVYKAKDLRLGRFVTFKVLKEEHLSDDEFVYRFKTEASAIASLSHPNIVNVYDVGQEGDINYIVMEYIKGVTLKDLIAKHAPFKEKEIYGVSIQIAEALVHAHKNGIIHRDIKPQNVLVTTTGAIKVMDFGIARSVNSDTIAIGGSTMGSVHYFSPEQARGSIVSYQSDLYSLGIVMYEMSTGKLPYDSDETISIALMHINDPMPDISLYNADVTESFKKIVFKLTEKKPQNRYQSAERLTIDLKRMMINPGDVIHFKDTETGENNTNLPDEGDDDSFSVNDEIEREMSSVPAGTTKRQEILLVVAALLTSFAIIAVSLYFLLPILTRSAPDSDEGDIVKVISFLDMQFDDALEIARGMGLELKVNREDLSDKEPGTILEQNYSEDSPVTKGTEIEVIVSKGTEMVKVPTFVNLDIDEARDIAGDDLFIIVVAEPSDTTARNIVISQSIDTGEEVNKGTEIMLTVSSGKDLVNVIVPDISGKDEDTAKQMLIDADLKPGSVTYAESSKYAKGLVIAQSITYGKEVPQGSIVSFELSSGPPPATPSPTPTEAPEPGPDPEIGPEEITKNFSINFNFPEDRDTILVTLYKITETDITEVYNEWHTASDLPIPVTLSGAGEVEFVLYVDGKMMESIVVSFN